jgi:hypothetical protein
MENLMNRRIVHILCSLSLAGQLMPASFAASQGDLNFKIYAPPEASAPAAPKTEAPAAEPAAPAAKDDSLWSLPGAEKPATDPSADAAPAASSSDAAPAAAADPLTSDEAAAKPAGDSADATATTTPATTEATSSDGSSATTGTPEGGEKKVLQGYIRVVPSGTKVPIIMDTAIDTDTSQEGDEFAARTSEDLEIDGQTVVPAGSIIKGRIAALNAPRNLNRSGSVALKFDTVTTPDNRQIPLVANLVAHGGVVHARRGLKDIAMDTGKLAIPTALGLGIGVLAGSASKSNNNSTSSSSSSKHIDAATGALIGAGVGAAVGIVILCISKGKKVDVRPGDELKIELAEDLRMPM